MKEFIIQSMTSSVVSTFLIAILAFFSRNLILERLKNAVKHDYDKKLKAYENKLDTHTQIKLAQLTNKLSTELEIVKIKTGPYSERQFNLYNELWISLCELKHAMLLLWDQASEDKFDNFSKKLEETFTKLQKSALVVEEMHYIELVNLLNEFAKYEMGKRELIDYRREQPIAPYNRKQVKMLIADNRATKSKPLEYLPQMMNCLRCQINGQRENFL